MDYYGIVAAGSTLRIFFTTHGSDGAAIAPSSAFEAADVRIYKDGSATQRSSEAGYTMTSPFDSVTGLHLLSVDLSDNTDAGFYAAGSRYSVILTPAASPVETVDGATVVRVLTDFHIGPAYLAAFTSGSEFFPVDAHAQDFEVSAGQLTTKKPDGSTDTAYSPKTITSDAAAEPITGSS